jgi:cytochrome c peroxidase
VANYQTFAPVFRSASHQGFTFSYGNARSFALSGRIIYVYDRPACAPAYCAPVAPRAGSVAGIGGGGDWDEVLASAAARYGVRPLEAADFPAASQPQVDLGSRLFNDTLLSANGDMACASCHLDQRGTSNDYALAPNNALLTGRLAGPVTAGAVLGRNTPALYNVGHASLESMFWDGRVARDPSQPSGFRTPAFGETPPGLASALAAQALFPLIAPAEMGTGTYVNGVYSPAPSAQWAGIMQRLLARSDYEQMFRAAYPEANGAFGIQHVANAIAAFESVRWRATNTLWDRYLAGDRGALNEQQKRGAVWFYTKGNCGGCHSGPLLSDGTFHATATPQFGPGAGDGVNGLEDYGVGRVTGSRADHYKFKTPSLRNVELTGPWGHDGAWTSLREVVEHYVDPAAALDRWNASSAILPNGLYVGAMLGAFNDPAARAGLKAANEAQPVALSAGDIDDIMEFLLTLTDASVAHNDHSFVVRH